MWIASWGDVFKMHKHTFFDNTYCLLFFSPFSPMQLGIVIVWGMWAQCL